MTDFVARRGNYSRGGRDSRIMHVTIVPRRQGGYANGGSIRVYHAASRRLVSYLNVECSSGATSVEVSFSSQLPILVIMHTLPSRIHVFAVLIWAGLSKARNERKHRAESSSDKERMRRHVFVPHFRRGATRSPNSSTGSKNQSTSISGNSISIHIK